MADVKKTSKRAPKEVTKGGGGKRGIHPVESGIQSGGMLTIVAPAGDLPEAGESKQIRVEYLTEGEEFPAVLPSPQNPDDAPAQVAAALIGIDDVPTRPPAHAELPPPTYPPTPAAPILNEIRTPVPSVVDDMQPIAHAALTQAPYAPPPAAVAPNAAPTAGIGHAVPPPASFVPMQPLLFEIAWEVCWQLGGIYTVIRSKAPQMTRSWGERYCLIGPYNKDTADVELEECQPTGPIAIAIERLRALGIRVHYGHWLVTGRPRVILLEFGAAMDRLGEFKYYLWKDHGIQTNENDWEVNNVVSFGFLVGLFFQELTKVPNLQLPVLAHFHEWMGGLGAMRIKHLNLPVATVFTTHATLLGRYLCTDNPDFYNKLPWINPDHAAGHYNIYARYSIERGSTHCSDVFTTVSDITGLEAEKLLGRRPDMVTPNGLNIHKFSALHEFQNLHKQYKEVIHQFVAGHFFPSYNFDLEKTIYLFISGRYEYRNKGMDLFIESLARLNHWLRAGGIPVTVVAFIITKAPNKNINVDVLRNQSMFDELSKMCGQITEEMGQALLHSVSMGRLPERGELMTEESVVRLKRGMHAWRSSRQPPIVTHDLWHDGTDPVLTQLRSCQLFNARHDAVKVVFHPDFVSATSPLIGLDYDQFIRGCHMGVFPSYYEPWGYTPAECVASGVPSVTSDLAGFGSYVQQNIQDPNSKGLFIVGRRYASWEQSAHQLTEILFNFCLKDRRTRIELRNRTERLSDYFDWSNLISHYNEAHKLAMQRKAGVTI
ncbi:MAG TPA: glycosyltransferase [Phycisphaerae bacterium]|nr:glycosyltransferase [Phycisphaerae bacterium]